MRKWSSEKSGLKNNLMKDMAKHQKLLHSHPRSKFDLGDPNPGFNSRGGGGERSTSHMCHTPPLVMGMAYNLYDSWKSRGIHVHLGCCGTVAQNYTIGGEHHRIWSMFPLTRASHYWCFEPQPLSEMLSNRLVLGALQPGVWWNTLPLSWLSDHLSKGFMTILTNPHAFVF